MQELETHNGHTLPSCDMCTHMKVGRSMKEATLNKGIASTKSPMDTFVRTAKLPPTNVCVEICCSILPFYIKRKMTAQELS